MPSTKKKLKFSAPPSGRLEIAAAEWTPGSFPSRSRASRKNWPHAGLALVPVAKQAYPKSRDPLRD